MIIVISLHFSFLLFSASFFNINFLYSARVFFLLQCLWSICSVFSSLLIYIFLLPVPHPVDWACVLRSCLSWSHTSPEKETLQTIPLAGAGFFNILNVCFYVHMCLALADIIAVCVVVCVVGLCKHTSGQNPIGFLLYWPEVLCVCVCVCFNLCGVLVWFDLGR